MGIIETKEKYEEFKEAGEKFPNFRIWSSDIKAIVETIEALREVARLADEVCNIGALAGEDEALDRELMLKLRALPDWLLEDQ